VDEAALRLELARLKRLGADHATVEIKKARGGIPQSLWESISAFANADGGTILLGIDESAEFDVCGVNDPASMESQLASQCAAMEPVVRADISTVYLGDRAIVVAVIPPIARELRPCHKKSLGAFAGSRLRVSDGDRKLTDYEVVLLLAARSEPRDDRELIGDAVLDDLNSGLLDAYLRRVRERSQFLATQDDHEILRMTNVVGRTTDGALVPTLAGILAFGRYPQQFVPQLNITVVVYPTTEPGVLGARGERLIDNRPIDGPIPAVVRDAIRVLKLNMRRRSTVSGLIRVDEWEYPEEVLREALVNALVHRDYSRQARGMQVQVEVFPDRLLVRNPGGLFGPVEISSLGARTTTSTRNPALLKMMEDTTLDGSEEMVCENRGTGIARMRQLLSEVGMEPPEFRDNISTFEVEFPNHTLLDQETLDWLHELDGRPLSRPQMTLLASMRNDPDIPATNSSFRELTGVQDSRVATRELGELVTRGLLTLDGTRGGATYWLSPESAEGDFGADSTMPPLDSEMFGAGNKSLTDQQVAVLDAIDSGARSRKEIADKTRISSDRAASTLQTLKARGLIVLEGPPRSRNAKWRRVPGR
jgi:ATP-dependent DNA helicase RecG